MGFKLPSIDVSVTKTMNCVISAEPEMIDNKKEPLPCIRCSKCAEACPVSLQPQELYWFSKSDQFEKAQDYNLFDCIECGCCSYVCPSNIPLVQFYRYAKSEIIAEFGTDVLGRSGNIDKPKLARIAFQDENHQLRLNTIIHPYVFKEIDKNFDKVQNSGKHDIFIVDAALIYSIFSNGR